MFRKLAICTLVFALGGCGGDEEAAELKAHVTKLQQFDGLNRQVAEFIARLDDPSYEIAESDLVDARGLIDRYVAEIGKIPSIDIEYRELRVAHDLYGRKLAEAKNQAADSGRELKRERGNVAIGMRYIRQMTELNYKAIDVLWFRKDQPEEFPLKWPE